MCVCIFYLGYRNSNPVNYTSLVCDRPKVVPSQRSFLVMLHVTWQRGEQKVPKKLRDEHKSNEPVEINGKFNVIFGRPRVQCSVGLSPADYLHLC